ncbi:MAG: methyltransferase domain-containing protein [bacterium]|nr:methyltransferase domain-containing protein [bacterium]
MTRPRGRPRPSFSAWTRPPRLRNRRSASTNLAQANVPQAEVRLARSEEIPYDDDTFDVVISNGVLNLSPQKEETFQEIFRVLRPDGRLQFADIVLKEGVAQQPAGSADAWSQ